MSAVVPWALLVSSCVAYGASASSKETVAFDPRLLNQTVEAQGCEPRCLVAAPPVSDGAIAGAGSAAPAVLDSGETPVPNVPGATVTGLWNSPRADDEDDFLPAGRRLGIKKFLLAVFFLGGWIRYLTSAAYRKFLSEVFDPLEW